LKHETLILSLKLLFTLPVKSTFLESSKKSRSCYLIDYVVDVDGHVLTFAFETNK